jgi:tetratricopeptide (TPR) repeat protein
MLTREQIINLTEFLAAGSITAAGFAIGDTIAGSVIAGIGMSLGNHIIRGGASKLKEKWLTSTNGILNHDVQRALLRAYIKALAHLQGEYLKLYEANQLQENEKEPEKAIRALFQELTEQAEQSFLPCIEKAIKEQELKEYIYDKSEKAIDTLWDRINADKLLHTYNEHFRHYLHKNLLKEVQFYFAEELKTDNRECNKAWRAFQRMLLEGIQADLKEVQAGQEIIQQDLQLLHTLREQLDRLQHSIDRRTPGEPFQSELDKAVVELHTKLVESLHRVEAKVERVDETTIRTELKLDTVAADVKTLIGSKTKTEIAKLPEDIQKLIDEGFNFWDTGKYEAARNAFHNALGIATGTQNKLGIAKAKYCLSTIVNEWDRNPDAAKESLQESLQIFRNEKSEIDVAATLYQLGAIEIDLGNLDQAESYLTQALELDKKNEHKQSIAHTLHQLGWLEDHRGNSKRALEFYDQALNGYLSVYHQGDPKTEKDAIRGIASCYHHKGLVCRHSGLVEDAESNFVKALEWYRKCDFKPEIGKMLYLLSELKYREAQYDAGNKFLDEALSVYGDIQDNSWRAKCLELRARVLYTLGRTDDATDVMQSSLEAAELAKDYKQQEQCLNKLGHIYLEKDKISKAQEYFEKARDISLREEFLDGYASSVKNLSEIAQRQKDSERRNKLLSEGIQTLEKLLLSVQPKPKRAFVTGQIGFFYEGMEIYEQALIYYQRAKKAFEELFDIGGIANALGSIARMKGKLGHKNEEFDTYREIKKVLDGTAYYDLIAGTAINLGEIQLEMGNIDEAKILFEEALSLCEKYNLQYLEYLEKAMEQLTAEMNLRKPPDMNFKQLVEELFELVDWFPEAKDSIFRLWMWGRKDALLANYRGSAGIKFMICQDNLDYFDKAAEILSPYADLCLQVVSSKYPGSGLDLIPYPPDKPIFFECAFPAVRRINPKE